jgi:hypothetical protein
VSSIFFIVVEPLLVANELLETAGEGYKVIMKIMFGSHHGYTQGSV